MAKANILEKLAQMKAHAQLIIELANEIERSLYPTPPKKKKSALTDETTARIIANRRKVMLRPPK